MNNPFVSRHSRKFKMMMMIPVLTLLTSIYESIIYENTSLEFDDMIFVIALTLFPVPFLITCYAVVKIIQRLKMKSTSSEVKSRVINVTLGYFAIYSLTIV